MNDRWDSTHADYLTTKYEAGRANERAACWENCRGTGFSFGYNQAEGPVHLLDPAGAVRLLVDVVSRGGNLLLNVGPKADGTLPPEQRAVLEGMASWMARLQLPSQARRVGDVDDRLVEPAGSFGQGGQGCGVASGHGRSHAAAQRAW